MAPEHADIERLAAGTGNEDVVRAYVNAALNEPNDVRGAADQEKTGVFLGRHVVNPVNGEAIPMYVADYVLMEYGTGAIMAVPAHDDRDYAFAKKFGLPIRRVIEGENPDGDADGLPYVGDGPLVNSAPEFNGLPNREALEAIVAWLDREGKGHASVNYRLRDWLLSRQRYWGCPIPVVHCDACGIVPVPGRPAAGRAPGHHRLRAQGPLAAGLGRRIGSTRPAPTCGGPATRETDTMDTFVDSSWYFLRYCDARNDEAAWDPAILRAVDARRPVHRRRRARDPAPDVRALLLQGAEATWGTSTSRSRSRSSSRRG